jgi:hypothetical protein
MKIIKSIPGYYLSSEDFYYSHYFPAIDEENSGTFNFGYMHIKNKDSKINNIFKEEIQSEKNILVFDDCVVNIAKIQYVQYFDSDRKFIIRFVPYKDIHIMDKIELKDETQYNSLKHELETHYGNFLKEKKLI